MTTAATTTADARHADDLFFASLRSANVASLGELLSDDFVLVDVMRGGVITRPMLLEALRSGKITFDGIDVIESQARSYGAMTAIIVGRTRMHGRAADAEWSVSSRYTHVFVHDGARWRLASAQGTAIIDP